MLCKLGLFKYKPKDITAHPIQTKSHVNRNGDECVSVGQFKNGTDDLDGVGTQVDCNGNIREGYWSDGQLNGQGRRIYHSHVQSSHYYIGEYREGQQHNFGSIYNIKGVILRSGKWENNVLIEKNY